jgi:hypothetical protein
MKLITLITLITFLLITLVTNAQYEETAKTVAQTLKDSLYKSNGIQNDAPLPTLEQFRETITTEKMAKIDEHALRVWNNSFSEQEIRDNETARYQLSKPHLISWAPAPIGWAFGSNITITNNSGKTIKYINIRLTSTNSVNDPIQTTTKRVNGPVTDGESSNWIIDSYGLSDLTNRNNEIHLIHPTQFTVEYTDLTTYTETNITKTKMDSDLIRRIEESHNRRSYIKENIIDELYKSEITKLQLQLKEKYTKQKKLKDSIDLIVSKLYNDTLLKLYKKNYSRIHKFTNKAKQTSEAITKIAKLNKQKKKFIKTIYNIDADLLQTYAKFVINETQNEKNINDSTLECLIDYKNDNDNLISNIFKTSRIISDTGHIQLIFDKTPSIIINDSNFMSPLRLKKTNLYKIHKDEYRQKKIDAIQPISKHFTALYVYSGGWSPYGVNITLHPFDNISFSTEYTTQGQMQTIDPNSYDNYSTQKFFDNVRQNNIYKLEDTWDANRQTLSLSLLFPINYKKNLLIGFGMGKTITTEYKRYQLPNEFNFEVESIKYPQYFTEQQKMTGQFYLETDKRISSNLNYNINLTLILKPITIKLGTIINDKNRRDTRLNLGIGLTF